MSILDDAIREHLELKRAHGADEAEVKKLEDEAFGPPGRPEEPDPFAEAPTEFLTTPETPEAEAAEEGGRRINIADLQEAPQSPPIQDEPAVEAKEVVEPQGDGAPLAPAEDPAQAAPPAEEEPMALEHELVSDPEAEIDAGHSTEERHAIAEQPTEFFDVEAEMGTEDAPAIEAAAPADEAAEAEASAPQIVPDEPATEIHASRAPAEPLAEEDEEDEEFWSDQRLSEELDQALEAPLTEEHEVPGLTDDAPSPAEEHEVPAPAAEPTAPLFDQADEPEPQEQSEHGEFEPKTGHEDVLEDTPEFLEDAPEDDELWFEQRPPKDFDFDD